MQGGICCACPFKKQGFTWVSFFILSLFNKTRETANLTIKILLDNKNKYDKVLIITLKLGDNNKNECKFNNNITKIKTNLIFALTRLNISKNSLITKNAHQFGISLASVYLPLFWLLRLSK